MHDVAPRSGSRGSRSLGITFDSHISLHTHLKTALNAIQVCWQIGLSLNGSSLKNSKQL